MTLALAAGVLGGVVGTGSSLILLPVLVLLYGPRAAVPVMGIAAVMGNVGRVIAWWKEIRWRPVVAYSIPGIPLRRIAAKKRIRIRLWQMAVAGAIVGYLTGLVLSTGPLSVPIFTGYGLSGGAFLGSEAASSVLLYLSKLTAFQAAGALPLVVIARGLIIGTALLIGTIAARRIVRRIHPRTYELLIYGVLVAGAAGMLLSLS